MDADHLFEKVVKYSVGTDNADEILMILRDRVGIANVKDLQDMLVDDASFAAISGRHADIGVADWARIRRTCKAKTLIVAPDADGEVHRSDGQVFHLEAETTWLKWVPMVNILHDYFDSAPDPNSAQLLMNLILLMDALMLGTAFGLPSSMGGYDQARATIARFNGEGQGNDLYNKWCVETYGSFEGSWKDDQCGWSMMINFTTQSTRAACWFGGSILCILGIYTFFSITNFAGPDVATSRLMMKAWWRFVQLAILLSILLMCGGVMYTFGSVKMIATFNYPDWYLDPVGKYEYTNNADDPKNTVNYFDTQSYAWCVSMFLCGAILSSLGLAWKSYLLKKACNDINSGVAMDKNVSSGPNASGTGLDTSAGNAIEFGGLNAQKGKGTHA